jgi:hypothetical protein
VISFLVELCEMPGCTDPILDAVFSSIADITEPGNATTTGPLFFSEITQKFLKGEIWRYRISQSSLSYPPFWLT